MFGISMWELLLVGVILFLVVGPAKLPGLAKQLGQGLKDIRKGLSDIKGSVDQDDEFVKAVTDARRTVVEAKESFRSLLDDMTNIDEDEDEEARDPAPKPVPRGLKMVSPGVSGQVDGGERKSEVGPVGAAGPALADTPVEAEDYRASRRGEDASPPPRAESAAPTARIRNSGTGRKMIRPGREVGPKSKPE
ncbi:MAG: twin-arginine translocase TatA/TatE family subunit [bacterium]